MIQRVIFKGGRMINSVAGTQQPHSHQTVCPEFLLLTFTNANVYPSESHRTVSWTYAAKGFSGIYLSRREYEDNDWSKWNDLVATTELPKHVTVKDIHRFKPGVWLNDALICAYGLLCLSVLPPHILESVRFVSVLFWQGLSKNNGKQEHWKKILRKRVGYL